MGIQLFQIKPHGVDIDTAKIDEAKENFAERECVLLSQILEPELLARLIMQIPNAPAQSRSHGKSKGKIIGNEVCVERDAIVTRALTLLLNKPELLRLIEQVTECRSISRFLGRIYMMRPNSADYDSWHSDNDGNRMIGISLNLSGGFYSGGDFQIRERQSEKMLGEIANKIPGDAHIFRISPDLQHFVAPVTGQVTKTAFAGWFCKR